MENPPWQTCKRRLNPGLVIDLASGVKHPPETGR